MQKLIDAINDSPIKSGAILGVVLVLILGVGIAYSRWDVPLGPALDLPTATSEATETLAPTETSVLPSDTPDIEVSPTVTNTPMPTMTPTIEPMCGGPNQMTILVAGVASDGYLYGLADAIRVARVDFQTGKIQVVAIPRDLWVDIPAVGDHGIEKGKLNQAYFYGTEGMGFFDGSGYGSGLLAQTLQEEFGLHVDHYLAVNLHAFRNIIDGIGGVDVYLPEPVYTKWFEEPKLFKKAGTHHLTGKEAEKIVRARIEIGDYGRINNQTIVLRAIAAKMITPSGLKNLPEIVSRLINYTLTDLSPSDVSQLLCLAEKVDPREDVAYEAVPDSMTRGEWVMDEYQGYQVYALMYEEEEMRELFSNFQKGLWP
jgi:LCP family protein required for cell wall assembly